MDKTIIEQYKNKLLKNSVTTHRDYFIFLKEELKTNNLVLIGLRQLGKTILAEQLVKDYLNIKEETNTSKNTTTAEIPNDEHFLYLNLKSFPEVDSPRIQAFINEQSFKIVFIDEVQLIENWSNMVQVLVDMNPNTRFIFTGSNASALSRETAFGRVKIFNIFPLDFKEFKSIWSSDNFKEYLEYGSYPKSRDYNSPLIQYKEMLNTLIIDKIASEDNTGISISKLRNFTKSITDYIGNEINVNKLNKDTGISRPTITAYIKIMKEASLIRSISKYNDKNRNVKNKVYFVDKSMFPYFIPESTMDNNQKGSWIENVVFMHLTNKYCLDYGSDNIFYFRNNSNSEIDFIIPDQKQLIEVKYHEQGIDMEQLSKQLNKTIENNDFIDYEKLVITYNDEGNFNDWKFIPLINFLGGR